MRLNRDKRRSCCVATRFCRYAKLDRQREASLSHEPTSKHRSRPTSNMAPDVRPVKIFLEASPSPREEPAIRRCPASVDPKAHRSSFGPEGAQSSDRQGAPQEAHREAYSAQHRHSVVVSCPAPKSRKIIETKAPTGRSSKRKLAIPNDCCGGASAAFSFASCYRWRSAEQMKRSRRAGTVVKSLLISVMDATKPFSARFLGASSLWLLQTQFRRHRPAVFFISFDTRA